MLSHMETQEADSAGEAPRIVAAQITPCPQNIHMHREPRFVFFLFVFFGGGDFWKFCTKSLCNKALVLWSGDALDD